jgi:hypothetical protein
MEGKCQIRWITAGDVCVKISIEAALVDSKPKQYYPRSIGERYEVTKG